MNYQDPPLPGQAKNVTYDYDRAAEKDARLQADPELASSEGRITLPVIAVYFTAMVVIVGVVLYGLNNQRDETVNASAPAAEAPANDTGAAPQQQGNAPASQPQGQNNQPPKQQSQDNQQPAQPQQNAEKPAAQQQNAPAPKQQ